MIYKLPLIIIFCALIHPLFGNNIAAGDTSAKALNKLYELKFYYINQLAKDYIPASEKAAFTAKMETVDKEIKQFYENKRAVIVQSGNTSALTKFQRDSTQREDDIELSRENKPAVYAYEIGSSLVGMYVSYMDQQSYSPPFSLFYEKAIHPKISLGGFLTYFTEKNVLSKPFLTGNEYYRVSWENYKYKYYSFGARASYHFLDPEKPFMKLNAYHFDLYATAMVGYTIVSNPAPLLRNNIYDKEPSKDGINAGAMIGGRYMYDERLGFFAEAGFTNTSFFNIGANYRFFKKGDSDEEKPAKSKKGKSSSKSKSKSSSNKKAPAKKAPAKKAPAKKAPAKKAPVKKRR
jgi:hypothetical protein